jgi:hypothetical protein
MLITLLTKIAWVIVAIIWAKYHAKIILKEKREPGSISDYALRVFIALVLIWTDIIVWGAPYPESLQWLGADLIAYAGIFWLVFDIHLNDFTGKASDYISTTNGKFFDKIFRGDFNLQLTVKLIVIFAGILARYL